jgi:hypothetical protein
MHAIWQTFSVDRPKVLSFDWNYLSHDFPDAAYVGINETILLLAGAGLGEGRGWVTQSFFLPAAGDYTLTFGVINGLEDTFGDAALLVDNVRVTAPLLIPEPKMPLLLLAAIGALASTRTPRRKLH